MRNIMILSLVGSLGAFNAYADCAAVPDKVLEVRIDAVITPVYRADGAVQNGCLLRSGNETLGYATSDVLCESEGTRRKVKLSYGCCDTGPDHGDTECTVRSKTTLSLDSTHGNGVRVDLFNNPIMP